MLVCPPNDVGMWGKLWVPRRGIYVDVVWDNHSRRTLAFMASFAQAKRIQKVVSHGKVVQTPSPHINSTTLRGSQFHREKKALRYVWMPSVVDHDHVEPRMPKASLYSTVTSKVRHLLALDFSQGGGILKVSS